MQSGNILFGLELLSRPLSVAIICEVIAAIPPATVTTGKVVNPRYNSFHSHYIWHELRQRC